MACSGVGILWICSDRSSELTIADAGLPLDHGAASSEWSCPASLFNGAALVKRIHRFHCRFSDLKPASDLFSESISKEGLLETWNNANADLDMVQKGTPENLASNFDIAGVVEFDLEPPDVALVLRVRLS